MSECVIVLLGPAGTVYHGPPPPRGAFLKSYDPDAHDGMGRAVWTRNVFDARRFSDIGAALDCYNQVPQSRPLRDDAKPNRPLTAYTIEVIGV